MSQLGLVSETARREGKCSCGRLMGAASAQGAAACSDVGAFEWSCSEREPQQSQEEGWGLWHVGTSSCDPWVLERCCSAGNSPAARWAARAGPGCPGGVLACVHSPARAASQLVCRRPAQTSRFVWQWAHEGFACVATEHDCGGWIWKHGYENRMAVLEKQPVFLELSAG